MLAFAPAILRGDTLFDWPRPLPVVRWQDAWDWQILHIPLQAGALARGGTRQGVRLTLSGELLQQDGTLLVDEADQFAQFAALRTALDPTLTHEKFTLLIYRDNVSGATRQLEGCVALAFEGDLSDPNRLRYTATLHADDPTLHTGLWPVP